MAHHQARRFNFDYDALGRLIDINAGGQAWTLAYSSASNRIILRDSNGNRRLMGFDALNRLTLDTVSGNGRLRFH